MKIPCCMHTAHGFIGCDCKKTTNLSNSARTPGSVTEQAEKIAKDILDDYMVLAHDGNGLNGECYWVEWKELAEAIKHAIEMK